MNQNLHTTLRQLRLSGLGHSLEVRLQEAAANRLTHFEFLELILEDELSTRRQCKLDSRIRAAEFRALKPLDDFDRRFNPSIPRKDLYDLAAGHFIARHEDVLFVGPPGVGKTMLAQALGYEAIKQGHHARYRSIIDLVRHFLEEEATSQRDRVLRQYLKPDLLIIDDMGLKAIPKHSGEYLMEIIVRPSRARFPSAFTTSAVIVVITTACQLPAQPTTRSPAATARRLGRLHAVRIDASETLASGGASPRALLGWSETERFPSWSFRRNIPASDGREDQAPASSRRLR